ncbi:BTB/POZ domain-containing protein 1-like [Pecten maximus]|uniref:BTB/POZ domain-containing protein 1-like n=1 Tax=Pecten maximus TaxID=6579 RepID=UPI001458FF23|nr:BTB/POZ domain-containing protein 1-like [Pecten maximus]
MAEAGPRGVASPNSQSEEIMTATESASDWQCGKRLHECFDHLFTSGLAADVTFLVGKHQKRVTAHRLVLISRSPVFYAMLEGPMAEKGEITIPDISEKIFIGFLRFLYTDRICFTEKNVFPILNAARKYCVDILVSRCEKFLSSNLSEANACLFMEHAHLYSMDQIKMDCLKLISGSANSYTAVFIIY